MNRFQKIIERFNLLETDGDLSAKRKAEEKKERRKKRTSYAPTLREAVDGLIGQSGYNPNRPIHGPDGELCEELVTDVSFLEDLQASVQRQFDLMENHPLPDLRGRPRGNSRTSRENWSRRPR